MKTDFCFDFHDGSDGTSVNYTGSVNFTISGKICDPWQFTKRYDYLEGNTCMSPDHDADIGVWCFCTDCENGWEKCPVPSCEGPQYQVSLEIFSNQLGIGYSSPYTV